MEGTRAHVSRLLSSRVPHSRYFIYVCRFIHICTCMYICVCTYMYTQNGKNTGTRFKVSFIGISYICVHKYIYMSIYVCICMYI